MKIVHDLLLKAPLERIHGQGRLRGENRDVPVSDLEELHVREAAPDTIDHRREDLGRDLVELDPLKKDASLGEAGFDELIELLREQVLGADDPYLDVEVIALGWRFFRSLGLTQVGLIINSLGEPDDRHRFVDSLRSYFEANTSALSEESRLTLVRNPLRVLDSKRAEDATVIAGAPRIEEFLSPEAAAHFGAVKSGLDALGIPFTVNERLVRGLDYYRRTTFEFVGGTLDSAQNALGGGGRYDGLVEDLGGPATAGIGFAIGLDRTLLACDDEGVFPAHDSSVDVFVVDTTGGLEALTLTELLRSQGISSDRAYENRSMKSQMKAADRSGAKLAVIIGSDELAAGSVVVRPMEGGTQFTVDRSEFIDRITKALQ